MFNLVALTQFINLITGVVYVVGEVISDAQEVEAILSSMPSHFYVKVAKPAKPEPDHTSDAN